VEIIGEITDQEKNEFLGNAYAVLFPSAGRSLLGW
jgi:hypothetical protein